VPNCLRNDELVREITRWASQAVGNELLAAAGFVLRPRLVGKVAEFLRGACGEVGPAFVGFDLVEEKLRQRVLLRIGKLADLADGLLEELGDGVIVGRRGRCTSEYGARES